MRLSMLISHVSTFEAGAKSQHAVHSHGTVVSCIRSSVDSESFYNGLFALLLFFAVLSGVRSELLQVIQITVLVLWYSHRHVE